MAKSMELRTYKSESYGGNGGFVHVESADSGFVPISEVDLPCQGTWKEFTGDLKRTLIRRRLEMRERIQDIRETVKGVFHRDSA